MQRPRTALASVRVRLLGRSERAMHVLVYLLDDTHQRLSFVMEEIFLHVSMESRRTAPWPEDVGAKIDSRLLPRRLQAGWISAAVCRAIGPVDLVDGEGDLVSFV